MLSMHQVTLILRLLAVCKQLHVAHTLAWFGMHLDCGVEYVFRLIVLLLFLGGFHGWFPLMPNINVRNSRVQS